MLCAVKLIANLLSVMSPLLCTSDVNALCHYDECHYGGAIMVGVIVVGVIMVGIIIPIDIVLSVAMLIAFGLSVVAPWKALLGRSGVNFIKPFSLLVIV